MTPELRQAHPREVAYRQPAPGAPFGPVRHRVRVVYGAIVAVLALLVLVACGALTVAFVVKDARGPDDTWMAVFGVALVAAVLLFYAQLAAGLAWMHDAWSWLPPDQRWTKSWKGSISPEQATFFLLIPYFHYYWMFVVNLGLCDALERLRVRYPTKRAAPRELAIAASISQLIVPFPLASVLWWLYMRRVEAMTAEMASTAA